MEATLSVHAIILLVWRDGDTHSHTSIALHFWGRYVGDGVTGGTNSVNCAQKFSNQTRYAIYIIGEMFRMKTERKQIFGLSQFFVAFAIRRFNSIINYLLLFALRLVGWYNSCFMQIIFVESGWCLARMEFVAILYWFVLIISTVNDERS